MRRTLVALAVMGLAGCATYSDLKKRPADFSASTDKAPQDYVECVLPKWTDDFATAHIIRDGDASVLVAPVGGSTNAMAVTLSARSEGQRTVVEMRHLPSLGAFNEQWRKARTCL